MDSATTQLTQSQKRFAASIRLCEDRGFDMLCEQKYVCREYNRVRDVCATAGNIDECISIKMKSPDYEMCQGTSNATFDAPEFPTSTQFFSNRINQIFKKA